MPAEGGNIDPQLLSRLQDGRAAGNADFPVVNRQRHCLHVCCHLVFHGIGHFLITQTPLLFPPDIVRDRYGIAIHQASV